MMSISRSAVKATMPHNQAKVDLQLEQLTLEEKISLLAGTGFATTAEVPRLGIKSMRLAEGVNGVKDAMMIDSGDAVGDVLAGKGPKTVCFPSTSCFAATWDSELMFELGEVLAQQAREKGISTIMGPGVNLHRDPRGGRNFEYFSEDPLLTGQLAASMINGIQQNGVGACLKHFFANEAEDYRRSYNVTDPSGGRAFRELYLAAFEETLRHSDPVAVMTSYNKVNGVHTSQTSVINDILREEWGYEGAVQSDWFGTASVVESILAGQDLEMPGPSIWRGPRLLAAVKEGKVSETQITARARKMLEWIDKVTPDVPHSPSTEAEQTRAVGISRRVASEGTVLLKNKGSILPLDMSSSMKIAIIGQQAVDPPIGGGGSSLAPPSSVKAPLECLRAVTSVPELVRYSEGVNTNKLLPLFPPELISNIEHENAVDVSYYNGDSKESVFCEKLSAAQVMMLGHVKPGLQESGFRYEMATSLTPDVDGEHTIGVRSTGQYMLTIDGNEVLSASATVCNAEDLLFAPYSLEKSCTYPMRKGQSYAIRLVVRDQRSPKIKPFEPGAYSSALCFQRQHPSDTAIAEAAKLASESDVSIVFAGRNAEHESEGFDQLNTKLPRDQTELIQAVAAASKKTILVLYGGGAFDISSVIDEVDAIIYAHYSGQEVGEVIADIVSGKVNPSGKLANTWPRNLEDVATYNHFPATKLPDGTIELPLTEGLEVGYRRDWSQVAGGPRYWFGYGLSYTTFAFSNFAVHSEDATRLDTDSTFSLKVTVTNTGRLPGSEVVQIYVASAANSQVNGNSVSKATMHPSKALKGFRKVALNPSESADVEVTLDIRTMLRFWNVETSRWNIRKGVYTISVGSCYDACELSEDITISTNLEWSGL